MHATVVKLTSRVESAWQQANVVQAEADLRCGPNALKAEARHLVQN